MGALCVCVCVCYTYVQIHSALCRKAMSPISILAHIVLHICQQSNDATTTAISVSRWRYLGENENMDTEHCAVVRYIYIYMSP